MILLKFQQKLKLDQRQDEIVWYKKNGVESEEDERDQSQWGQRENCAVHNGNFHHQEFVNAHEQINIMFSNQISYRLFMYARLRRETWQRRRRRNDKNKNLAILPNY